MRFHAPALVVCLCTFATAASSAPGQHADCSRPLLRFSQSRGWAKDTNGLSYYRGEWHFFYQHECPGGLSAWGHAVSTNLVDWTELDDALLPDENGPCYSGSAVVDEEGVAGFGKGAHLLFYTAAFKTNGVERFDQRVAYSTDGRRYVKPADNLVLDNISPDNRDPFVFRHEPSGRWVMVLWGRDPDRRYEFWVFNSADLMHWTKTQTLYGGEWMDSGGYRYECPGLVELPVEGEDGTAWVLWGANRLYDVGLFDGREFIPFEQRLSSWREGRKNPWYAGQVFAGAPDGRRIWVGWSKVGTPEDSSFTDGFTIPQELTLRRTKAGLRLVRRPFRELEALRTGPAVSPEAFDGLLADAFFSATATNNDTMATFDIRGVKVAYNRAWGHLICGRQRVPWPSRGGRFSFRVVVDVRGYEIYSSDGLATFPVPEALPDPSNRSITVSSNIPLAGEDYRIYPLRACRRSSLSGHEKEAP